MKISFQNSRYYKIYMMLAIFIFFMQQGFYFIDVSKVSIRGVINYDDLWLIAYIVWLILLAIKHNILSSKVSIGYSGKYILAILISCFFSGITSMIFFQISFFEGIRSQRWFIAILLSYFILGKLFRIGKIEYQLIEEMLFRVGFIEAFIYNVQYFLDGKIDFLYVTKKYDYGDVRMYFDSCTIVVMIIISMIGLLKKFEVRYLVALTLGLFYELFVSKGRLENLAVITVLVVCFFQYHKNIMKKLIYIFLGAVLMYVVMLKSEFFVYIVETIFGLIKSDNSYLSTMSVRTNLKNIFSDFMNENMITYIVGCGYPNYNALSKSFLGNYLLEDNGIFAYFYVYGTIGVVTILSYCTYLWKKAYKIMVRMNEPLYVCILIFNFVVCYNMIFWWFKPDWTFIMVLLICCCEVRCGENRHASKEFID